MNPKSADTRRSKVRSGMTTYSANLGFLFTEHELPAAISAAAGHGFAAVECHWPYAVRPESIRAALDEARVPLLGLNTPRGGDGEFGLSAVPGREDDARATIDEAIDYAFDVGAQAVHVMAGNAEGDRARRTFEANLRHACDRAQGRLAILIEPLNPFDNPGYFLATTSLAADVIDAVGRPELKLMFDCYHVARNREDVIARFEELLPLIGHVQFAGLPDRGEPDRGTLDYREVFAAIADADWDRPLGAEYRPAGRTEDSLGWMTAL